MLGEACGTAGVDFKLLSYNLGNGDWARETVPTVGFLELDHVSFVPKRREYEGCSEDFHDAHVKF